MCDLKKNTPLISGWKQNKTVTGCTRTDTHWIIDQLPGGGLEWR